MKMPMNKWLIIDGETFRVPIIEMKRKGDIMDIEAKRTEDGTLHRETVVGTFYNYTLNFGTITDPALYERLWWVLTTPVQHHQIQLPGQASAFTGYFGSINDGIVLIKDDSYKAKGLSCNVVCTYPSRKPVKKPKKN